MLYTVRFSSSVARDKDIDLVQLCRGMDGSVLLKDDKTTSLWLQETEIGRLVVKRYNTKNTWHFVRRNFQVSRAVNCQKMSIEFTRAGISVPEPIGIVQQAVGPFKGRSWFVSRFIETESLLEFLKRNQDNDSLQFVSDRIERIFRAFQQHRLSHGDMKATNILVHDHELVMIDLDSARRHVSGAWHNRTLARDKRRFLANWNPWPEMRNLFSEVLAEYGIQER